MSGLKPYRRKPGVIDDAAADFAAQLLRIPLLNGAEVTITVDGTANRQQFRHGLERAFRGVVVTGCSSLVTTHLLHVLTAERATRLGVDVTKFVSVIPAIAAADTFTLWVF
jgi:hypothetical protein